MFLAIRDLTFARGRFALMAAVVALITFLVVLLSGLAAGLGNQSTSAVAALPADHLAFQQPTAGQSATFEQSKVGTKELDAWRHQPGVNDAALLGVAPNRITTATTQLSITAFGAPVGSFVAPAGVSGNGVALLGPSLRSTLGVSAGSTVTLGGEQLRVVATDDDLSFNHLPAVWVSLPTWDRLQGAPAVGSTASVVALRTGAGFDPATGDAAAATSTTTLTGAFPAIGSYSAENGSLTLIRVLLFAVAALVVGAFFTVWTIQRRPDLAVLKAIGATTRYLVTDSLAQAGAVLAIGTVVGGALAAGLGLVASGSVPFVVSSATTVFPLAVTFLTGLVGALAAVRSIVTVDPLTALGASR